MSAAATLSSAVSPFDDYLLQEQERDLLRISTAGSVDDGKSTLIGRLLYDSRAIYEDQLASVSNRSVNGVSGATDFALLTDGLRAEREQGITIDVAYRYFSTHRRKFIIADTPGHEQYTRNMATGASTANLAIILVDARKGVLPQSRRHAFIASLLGLRHLVVAVNKMDLVNFSEDVFQRVRDEFTAFAPQLDIPDVHFIPVSALHGDNIVDRSDMMPWFGGASLLEYLETVHIASDRNLREMRFPVQYVIRPNLDFRGYAGQLVSGVIRLGDKVAVLPSGHTSTVKSIVYGETALQRAFAPMSVTVCLEDDIDVGRGDMIVHQGYTPHVTQIIDARLVWMSSSPLKMGRSYLIKHTTHEVKGVFRSIRHKINVNTLERLEVHELSLNDIGSVVLETTRPLFVDPYRRNRGTGSFIVIDMLSNETVAAGMVTGREVRESRPPAIAGNAGRAEAVTSGEREKRYGHRGSIICLHEDSVADALERILFQAGCRVAKLDPQQYQDKFKAVAGAMLDCGMLVICCLPLEDQGELDELGSENVVVIPKHADPTESGRAAAETCQFLSNLGILAKDVL